MSKNLLLLRPVLVGVEGVNSAKNPSYSLRWHLEVLHHPGVLGILQNDIDKRSHETAC